MTYDGAGPGCDELRYIEPGTDDYLQAKEVRYQELYSDWDLPRSLVEDTDGRTYVHLAAFIDDRVVGYARIHLDEGESKIYQVCVDREYQGRGIARAMVVELIELAEYEGRTYIGLDAREHVIGFYESLGFETEGDLFLSGRTNTPHCFMRLRLE